ncbi:MAG: phosphotransferase [Mariprofundaceae bacterium]
MADQRLREGREWVISRLGSGCEITILAGDASFRRYFRVVQNSKQFVLMDAPPEKEDVIPFLNVRSWLSDAGLNVPSLIHEDRKLGFLLLEDFGDMTWALHVDAKAEKAPSLDQLFENALSQLNVLQASTPSISLSLFDLQRMQRECDLYLDWYLPRVAAHTPTDEERKAFHTAMHPLLEVLLALPQVPVHLDYHSRNLMLPNGELPLGIIDFQDAVMGPITYDLASLLYDCYQSYPESLRFEQSRLFFESFPENIKSAFNNFEAWHRALRLTAMQRHIKAIGIFARLAYRDGKLQFLDEITLTRFHLQEEMKVLGMDGPEFSLLSIETG